MKVYFINLKCKFFILGISKRKLEGNSKAQPLKSLKDRPGHSGVFCFSHTGMKLQHQLSWGLEVAIIILKGWLFDTFFFFLSMLAVVIVF